MANFIEKNQGKMFLIFIILSWIFIDVVTHGSAKRAIKAQYQEAHGLCEMFAGQRTVQDYKECYEKWGKPVQK